MLPVTNHTKLAFENMQEISKTVYMIAQVIAKEMSCI
jgi:hypothetical protein